LKYSMAKGNNWIMSQKPIQPRREANNRNHSTTPSEACHEKFRHWAHAFAIAAGSPWCFVAAVLLILGWGATGPIFHFSDTWQLVINTAPTIVTFLMVFLIQNTQNRDTKAIQLKLEQLLRGV